MALTDPEAEEGAGRRLPSSGFWGLQQPRAVAADGARETGLPGVNRVDDGTWQWASWNARGQAASVSVDGGLFAAFHGELHHADALRRALALPDGLSPAALVLAAWRRWNVALPAHLDGVFALVLRDGPQVYLYRDPSGLRDLHYTVLDTGLAVATHLDALVALPGADARVARRSLHEFLRLLDIAAPNTVYEGVSSAIEGQLLRWSPGQTALQQVPLARTACARPDRFEAAVDQLGQRLQDSIRQCLGGAQRPAAFLSGGIDSALLSAMAARQRPDLTLVTVGFEGTEYDESSQASRIAAHIGARHQVLRFGHADHLRALHQLAATMEQPMADPSTPATVLAFEHCCAHFDAVLDGTGADEAVGVMPPRHARLGVQWISLLPAALRHGLARAVRAVPPAAPFERIFSFDHAADLLVRWGGFRTGEIMALCREPVSLGHTRFWRTFGEYPRAAHFHRYSALIDAMPCGRLNQAMIATGAPVRFPFWGSGVNPFLRQLDIDFRTTPGSPKRILRALLSRHVPPSVWDSPKRGFTFPLHDFLSQADHALVREHLDAARWQDGPWLAADVVAQWGRRYRAGEHSLMFRVWALVVLSTWLEARGQLPPSRPAVGH